MSTLDRRALIIASAPDTEHAALSLGFGHTVVLDPLRRDESHAQIAGPFDVVVLGIDHAGPGTLGADLAHALNVLDPDGRVVLLATGAASVAADVDVAAWSEPLASWEVASVDVEPDATAVWLTPCTTPNPATGAVVLGAVLASRTAAPADDPAVPSAAVFDPDADEHEHARQSLIKAQRRAQRLARKVRRLERSRAVRVSTSVRTLRRQGWSAVRVKPLVVAVLAALVVAAAAVAIVVVAEQAWDQGGLAAVLVAVAVVGLLALARLEHHHDQTMLRLGDVEAALGSPAGTRRRIDRVSAELRGQRRALDGLDKRVGVAAAAGIDTARGVADLRTDLRAAHPERVRRAVAVDLQRQYEQLQGAMNLFALTDVRAPVPPLRGWAVSPDALLVLASELLRGAPPLMVECGSGSSTLWSALLIRKFGLPTRVVALEADPVFKEQTDRLLEQHDVTDLAEVRLAPLVPTGLPDHDTPWYDAAAFADLADIGLLFVDGPPEVTGPLARYPALPLMWSRLSESAVIVLDDFVRPAEQGAVERWLDEYATLAVEQLRTEKGTAILRRS